MARKSAFSLSDGNGIGYEIQTRKINGDDYQYGYASTVNKDMVVANFDYTSCPMMDMQVATTGYKGGDSGHGGRTTIDITLDGTFCGEMSVTHKKGNDRPHLHFSMGGDMELDQITDALFNAAIFLHKATRHTDFLIDRIKRGEEPYLSV